VTDHGKQTGTAVPVLLFVRIALWKRRTTRRHYRLSASKQYWVEPCFLSARWLAPWWLIEIALPMVCHAA
jgi:hypothetical protein